MDKLEIIKNYWYRNILGKGGIFIIMNDNFIDSIAACGKFEVHQCLTSSFSMIYFLSYVYLFLLLLIRICQHESVERRWCDYSSLGLKCRESKSWDINENLFGWIFGRNRDGRLSETWKGIRINVLACHTAEYFGVWLQVQMTEKEWNTPRHLYFTGD